VPDSNPFADPLRFQRQVPDCAIVIFGANGDLTKRKLIPSLYRLAYERRLPATVSIIGTSRTRMSDDEFRSRCMIREGVFGGQSVRRGTVDGLRRVCITLPGFGRPIVVPGDQGKLTGWAEQCFVLSFDAAQLYAEVAERIGASAWA